MHQDRLNKLQDLLTQQDLQALVLAPSPSLYYLTDLSFHLMERPVFGIFPQSADPVLCLPEMEAVKVAGSPLPLQTFTYDENPANQLGALEESLAATGLTGPDPIGVEPLHFRFYEWRLLTQANPSLEVSSADDISVELRATKDSAEIETMQRAVNIAEAAMKETLSLIKLGMSEQELAAELVVQLLRAGSQSELPFQPIVASGHNSALPHADAGSRKLAPQEFLLIDWGARVEGYCSDLTRTFALAEADDEMTAIHQAVLEANETGLRTAAPGVTAGAVDRAARDRIKRAGYGQYFTHRLGHGLGLEVHEAPYLYADNDVRLKPGHTCTVEPGVYIPAVGGVRIEDDIVITQDGARSLSTISRELQVIA